MKPEARWGEGTIPLANEIPSSWREGAEKEVGEKMQLTTVRGESCLSEKTSAAECSKNRRRYKRSERAELRARAFLSFLEKKGEQLH